MMLVFGISFILIAYFTMALVIRYLVVMPMWMIWLLMAAACVEAWIGGIWAGYAIVSYFK